MKTYLGPLNLSDFLKYDGEHVCWIQNDSNIYDIKTVPSRQGWKNMRYLSTFMAYPTDLFYRLRQDRSFSLGDHWINYYPGIPL